MNYPEEYDIIIIGGGHAAYGAAQVASKMGMKTIMVTPDIDKIGFLSCNPSLGSVGRSQLARDLDALGADILTKSIDMSATNLNIINQSKGPAMQAHHAIVDKELFRKAVLSQVQALPNVTIFQQSVDDVIVENNQATGVITNLGLKIKAKAVIVCAGTFINGKLHTGLENRPGGRAGEAAATSLGQKLKELKLPQGRMKTGTPPRLDGRTIDFTKMKAQWGDGAHGGKMPVFSFMGNQEMHPEQLPCWITNTNSQTHDILRSGFDRSPFIQERFEGKGPRYCPSIEDKITRFVDKSSHQIILEPEGLQTVEFYPNGISTSLPYDIQIKAIRSIQGLENAVITRPGYAVEYDYYDPRSFKQTLEFKDIDSLYMAGVPLGTSGYIEANALGVNAAINAARKIKGLTPWVPERYQSYLGVLVDDLTTQGITEPYRMFTSRAEYRLQLREDNADIRLTPIGRELGLIDDKRWEHFCAKEAEIYKLQEGLKNTWLTPSHANTKAMLEKMKIDLKYEASLAEMIKRPNITIDKLNQFDVVKTKLPHLQKDSLIETYGEKLADEIIEQVEVSAKYEGYINIQNAEIEKMKKMAHIQLPVNFDYTQIASLGTEVIQVLNYQQPDTLGQASRIPGVTPTAINILLIYLKKNKLLNQEEKRTSQMSM